MFGTLGVIGLISIVALVIMMIMEIDSNNAGKAAVLGFLISYILIAAIGSIYVESTYVNSPEYQQYKIRVAEENFEKAQRKIQEEK